MLKVRILASRCLREPVRFSKTHLTNTYFTASAEGAYVHAGVFVMLCAHLL